MKQREGSECFAEGSFFARIQRRARRRKHHRWRTEPETGRRVARLGWPCHPRRRGAQASLLRPHRGFLVVTWQPVFCRGTCGAAPASGIERSHGVDSISWRSFSRHSAWRSRSWRSCSYGWSRSTAHHRSPVDPDHGRAPGFWAGRSCRSTRSMAHAFIRTNTRWCDWLRKDRAAAGAHPPAALPAQGAARPSAKPGQLSQRRGGDRCRGRAGAPRIREKRRTSVIGRRLRTRSAERHP